MTVSSLIQRRQQLLSIYQAALRCVNGQHAVEAYLDAHPIHGVWSVVAIGKAATAMARGAQTHLGQRLDSGLVITKYGHAAHSLPLDTWQVLESGHPVPDTNSLVAGEALLRYLDGLPDDMPLLFLLSGGASALVEALPGTITLAELERANDWLLGSGFAIDQMNRVRKRLSCIKGGRLARHLRGRRCLQLLISDVPGDEPATIGSGPLIPSPDVQLPDGLPDWLQALLRHGEEEPAVDSPAFAAIDTHVVASNALARQAALNEAEKRGLTVHDHAGYFQGPVEGLAKVFADALLQGEEGIYLWGGESSVRLPDNPGRGGRNQHLALAAASLLAGQEHILLLLAGTDGTDGPTEETGALVDGGTVRRGEEEGLSVKEALAHADSGRFLEASGDLVETGPTGTNVMDLVIGWRWDEG